MSGFGQHSVPLSNSWKANVPGMASQQKKQPGGPAAAGLKAKKQVILEEEDEVRTTPAQHENSKCA